MPLEPLHLSRSGQEYGTCAEAELPARVAAGEVLPTDYYWRAGMKEWALVSTLFAPRRPLPFARPADKDPNFLDDLFSRESKGKGLQLLWDRLAASPQACLVTESDHAQIKEAVGYDVRWRCKDELKQWYRQALAAFLADRLFTPDEKLDLGNLARSFGFDADTELSLHRSEFESYYSVGAMTCLLRAAPTAEKARQLAALAREVPLPPSIVAEVKTRAFKVYFNDLYRAKVEKEDGEELVDPVVADEWRAMGTAFGLDLASAYPELSAQVARSAHLWQLYRAPLRTIASDSELGGEACYWQRQVDLYQNKRVTVRRSYGGFSSSIRLFGGLRYRVGSYDVERQTEDQVVQVDSGRLLFLAQRVVFDGKFKNFNFKYGKVMDITAYTNALAISRDSGPDLIFLFPTGQAEAAVILRRLVRQAKG